MPLDPALPADRLCFMTDDAGMPVIITDAASAASLPPAQATVMNLDQCWPAIAALDDR